MESFSNIQISLAVVGGLILAAVVIHGAWTSRRNQPRQAEQETGRIEPGSEPDMAQNDQDEGSAADESSMSLPLPIPERSKPQLDSLIDVIATIELEAPIAAEFVLQHMPTTRRVGTKPMALEGLNEQTGQWEPPQAGARYSCLQAGVQLANRVGPLNEIEFSEFVVKTQALSDSVGGEPEFPDMLEEVARARELDQFASTHDAQLSVTLRARNAAWSPGYVQQNVARLGFVAGVLPGRMVLPSSQLGLPPILALTFDSQAALAEDPAQSALYEVSLTLDVPQVDQAEQPFAKMREAAQYLSEAMDAIVTDDNGQPLGVQALDHIAAELEKLYETLAARDIAAGSGQARRLFS